MIGPSSSDEHGARAVLALAEAIVPGGLAIHRADEGSITAARALLDDVTPRLGSAWTLAAQALDLAAVVRTGRRFAALDHRRQDELLERWEAGAVSGPVLQAFALPIRLAHFDRDAVYACLGGTRNDVRSLEQPRWLAQVIDSGTLAGDEDVECDVVVVGTGAGGAIVGKELADAGLAVCFLEEGEHVRRDRFTGSSTAAHRELYRAAIAVGRTPFPIFVGRLVGGSTAVNGATTFRTPPWVLERFCRETRCDDFAPARMAAHFEKVERTLGVAPAEPRFVGPILDVYRRGCAALGWSHFVVRRNAPGCEGSGFCDFGCRTGARRSMDVSYVPAALSRGARLYTRAAVERVILDGDRAAGVEARTPRGRLRVRGRAVVLAGGALPTPLLLLRQGLANRSGEVGRNLTLHPSGGVTAVMESEMRGWERIPQGCGCDEHLRDGILLTAAQPDVNYASMLFPVTGDRLMERISNLPWTASFGVMIADAGKGRVVRSVAGAAVVRYDLLPADIERYHRALVLQSEIALAAGAREVMPILYGGVVLRTRDDLERFRRRPLRRRQLALTSYHPLGTVKMGRSPRSSVVDSDHQCHDVQRLFVVDGSVVPGPLGVNPQLTIMAMATRAADRIADHLTASS